MRHFLILKLQGPLQAWGRESFEGLRPSELFPGRSALLGLLGACLGIDRSDREGLQALAVSILFAVRVDQVYDKETDKPIPTQKMTDYHTVKNAREEYHGLKSHDTIQTWREYWQDALYTIAVWSTENVLVSLNELEQALKHPLYTPTLGRRSCPLARPLFDAVVSADSALSALAMSGKTGGTIYSEEFIDNAIPIKMRDVPIIHQPRQFASRMVYMSNGQGGKHVSK